MRRKLLIIALIIPLFVSGQKFNLGIRGGLNSNMFITSSNYFKSGNSKIGFAGGLFFKVHTNHLWFQPEIILSQKSGMFSFSILNDDIDTFIHASLTNIDIPLLVGIQFGNTIKLGTGPVLTYPLIEKVSFNSTTSHHQIEIDKTMFKKATYGWQFKIAFERNRYLFDIRYELGIEKVNQKIDLPNQTASFNPVIHSRTWQFTIGYLFINPD